MKPRTERRLTARTKCAARARIMQDGRSMADCHVVDLTDRGARLELTHRRGIPQTFTLVVEHPVVNREVEVIWQSSNQIGVYFLPEETAHADDARSPSRSKAMSLADLRKIIGA